MAADPEVKVLLERILAELRDIHATLAEDRRWMWRILALAIAGAFAVVGVKLALP